MIPQKIVSALKRFIAFAKSEHEPKAMILLDTSHNEQLEKFVRNYFKASAVDTSVSLESENTLREQGKTSNHYSMVLRTSYLETL